MKHITTIGISLAAGLVSCQQTLPEFKPQPEQPAAKLKQTNKLAQLRNVSDDPDAAFEQQAAEYARAKTRPAAPQPADDVYQPPVMDPTPGAQNTAIPQRAHVNIPEPQPVQAAPSPQPAPEPDVLPAPAPQPVQHLQPSAQVPVSANQPVAGQPIDYTVSISNKTQGQLFVEAQDAAGTIYPCGPMAPNKTWNTPMTKADPIKWPITVVVRDPDQPGAPEIRRYKVNTPVDYANRNLNVSIIPGGQYQVNLDGQPVYVSPVH